MCETYSILKTPIAGTSGTGLDQLVALLQADPGLAGNTTAAQLKGGAEAANALNLLIKTAARNTGASNDGMFTVDEVRAMNAWIQTNRYDRFVAAHGDDENGTETGFHLVQGNGGTTRYRDKALVDTVMDGIYHIGFDIVGGRFVNEDGNANASLRSVANWLTQFWTDRATTSTGLDQTVYLVQADAGLSRNTAWSEVAGGMDAANGINGIIAGIIDRLDLDADRRIDARDVRAINKAIRDDPALYQKFVAFHGDDENGTATGFHKVQGNGANTTFFGENLVDTVLDGIYHIGFAIRAGRFRNEDGDANATLTDVANWLDFFLSDVSTTGTGLDRITDTIQQDRGLSACTDAAEIMGGARAANGLNALLAKGIVALGVASDGFLGAEDISAISAWVQGDRARYREFLSLHGDDENGTATGFHKVQGNGGMVDYFGEKLIDTVADGIYHYGFRIEDGRLLNEDGNANAEITDVAAWLNAFYLGLALTQGGQGNDFMTGTGASEVFSGRGGNDVIHAGGRADLLMGGEGDDTLWGQGGDDQLQGGFGCDLLDGGEGSDIFIATGRLASEFQGFDTYRDTGRSGTDVIRLVGGRVDVGTDAFGPNTGIEVVDATLSGGENRIGLGKGANTYDFRGVLLKGNIVIDGGAGNDRILGSSGADKIRGGAGDDLIVGGAGNDDLFGATGNDRFQFAAGFGDDLISDFAFRRDKLVLDGLSRADAVVTEQGTSLVVSFGEDSITIWNMSLARLGGNLDLLFA